ncbi:MAG: glycosyltransferase family 4 protein [Geminocystis sp.]|nr:glycosyltransferase family 4 protein [Geminocystis sp.]
MKRLKEEGFEVHAVAPEDEYSPLLKEEFFFHPLIHLYRKGTNPLKDALLFLEYFRLYRKIKPDLVINYTIKPNIYSSLSCGILKIPVISVITGLGYVFIKGGFLRELVKILYRLSFRFNRYIILLNKGDKEVIQSLVSKDKIILFDGEGVDTTKFNPEICSSYKKLDKVIFLYIGRLLKEKGLAELIQACKPLHNKWKNFELWLLGSADAGNPGSLTEEEIKEIQSYEFVKIFPFTKDVREYICKADCVVLPTYYGEGVPRALLEAMAMEKPIITSDIPGCRELISNNNGLVVGQRDVGDLYDKMNEFLELPHEKRVEMGKRGREVVLKEYDEKIHSGKVYETYYGALKCT